MFGKLVKHEFRATARIIPFVFLVTLFLALVNVLSGFLDIGVASNISFGLTITMCIAQVAVAYALVIWRYYKNMYGSEGYLTHTLPVKTHLHLWSKLLVGYIWSVLSYAVSAGAVAIIVIAKVHKADGNLNAISTGYRSLLQEKGLVNYQTALWVVFGIFLLISILMVLTEAYFAITLGNLSKLHSLGVGGPILMFFLEYIFLQIVSTVSVLFIPIGVKITISAAGNAVFKFVWEGMLPSLAAQFNKTSTAVNESVVVGLGSYLLIPVLAILLLGITARIVSRHTSIR